MIASLASEVRRMYLSSRSAGIRNAPELPPRHFSHLPRILIIEDNADNAESMRVLLEMLGHEVRVSASGPEGVREAEAWRPDIVLSDIGLPGLDGYEVARLLRQSPRTRDSRLIAISGYGGDDVKDRCREVGFDVHLTKPVDLETLQLLLDTTGIVTHPAGYLP